MEQEVQQFRTAKLTDPGEMDNIRKIYRNESTPPKPRNAFLHDLDPLERLDRDNQKRTLNRAR